MTKKSILILIFLMGTCAGCQTAEPTTQVGTPTIASAPTSRHAPASSADTPGPADRSPTDTPVPQESMVPREPITLTTGDGVQLAGTLFGDGETAVILAHQGTPGADQTTWHAFAQILAEGGFMALAFDFRGIGQSEGTKDQSQLDRDVAAALQFLRDRGCGEITCVGASMGGTACMRVAIDDELAGLATLGSTMIAGRGRTLIVAQDELASLTLPKLFITAKEDSLSVVDHTTRMYELSPEPKALHLLPGEEHGTDLFNTDVGDELTTILLEFLEDLPAPSPTPTPEPTATSISQAYEVITNLSYAVEGDSARQLSLYLPPEAHRKPLALLVQGGQGFPRLVRRFAEWGYPVIAFKSRNDSYLTEIQDAFCALVWTHANANTYGFDAEQIVPVGGSMWGGNAALLGLVDDPGPFLKECPHVLPETGRVRAVIALAGVFDYSEEGDFFDGFTERISDFMGGTPDQVPENWAAASAITWVEGDEPSFLLIHGKADTNVHPHQSEKFAAALEGAGTDVELVLLPGVNHSSSVSSPKVFEEMQTFLQQLEQTGTSLAGGAPLIVFYSERDGNPELYTMMPDGSNQRRLTLNEYDDYTPVWSPDGSQIAFISDRDDPNPRGCFPNCLFQLYVINADGSDEHKMVETEFTTHHPDWHPNGSKVSFDTEFNLQGDIYVVNTDGSDLHLLIKDGFWADWSPDGTQIAFASNRDGNVEIYLADADGSNQRRLTDNPRKDFFPAWSPDGEKIAFMAGTGRGGQLFVMNVDGSGEQQLTTQGRVNEDPAWSPDGSQIVFQSSRDGNFEIYTLQVGGLLQGGEDPGLQRLTDTAAGDYWPSWGPGATGESGSIRFEKSAQTFPSIPTWKVGLSDLDGDGDLDAVFANGQANESQVWLNDGSGLFTDTGQRLGTHGHGVAVGDIDGDGDPDLIISTHRDSSPTRVYLNDGHAAFQALEGAFEANIGFSVDLFDLDRDGDVDAVGEGTSATHLYLNDGAGRFTPSEVTLLLTTVWGDLDSDGDVDLLIKEGGVGYSVRLNDGEGGFSQHWSHAEPAAMDLGDMALGDVDNDGDLDAIITNGHFQSTSHPALVFLNDGTGRFADSGQQLSAVRNAGVSLGDLDGDGDLDVVLTDHMEPCQIWRNDGSGRFTDSGFTFGDDQFYRHVHLGDLDGDGDLDIILAAFGIGKGPNEIWFNTTPAGESAESGAGGLWLGQTPPGLEMEVFAPGVVSIEEGKEYKITFSPDLQEIVFTRRTPGGRDDRLWYSRLEHGELTTPDLVPFSYDALETDPCYAPDGNRLYFSSWRPLPGEETPSAHHNVWFVDRTEDGWSEAQFLGPPLNDYRPV